MTSSPIATCVKRNVWFPGKRVSETKNVNMLSASIRSTSEASRRWYCRCQGVHGFGCPQQLRRQRLIIQQTKSATFISISPVLASLYIRR